MKKFLIIIILSFLYLYLGSLSAEDYNGKRIVVMGDSAASLGRGGTGVSSLEADLFYMNPASIASLERTAFSLNYGTLDGSYYNPDFTLAVPTSYGVFGTCLRMLRINESEDIESGYSIAIGGAKNFTDNLFMGIALNLFYGQHESDQLLYTGVTLGSIYRINFRKKIAKGFGFYESGVGFSIRYGLSSDSSEEFNLNQFSAGYNLQFFRISALGLGVYNDFSAVNGYSDYIVKAGLESDIYTSYIFRIGGIHSPECNYSGATVGLGYRFAVGGLQGNINYSLVYYEDAVISHYMGINAMYGSLDRFPPETEIAATERYISPNYDGKQDYAVFRIGVSDQNRIKGWRLQILDSGKGLVKEYRDSKRDVDISLSFTGFFKKVWQKREYEVVPELIIWDGTDSQSRIVPDGVYSYYFLVWDERDNISLAKKGKITVDSTSPKAVIETAERLFSPNNDRRKDLLKIKLDLEASPGDIWISGFINSEGEIVKSYQWVGKTGSHTVKWDGKGDDGSNQPEGIYVYYLKSTDKAGNSVKEVLKNISLVRRYEVADINPSSGYFSFRKDKEMRFFLRCSKKTGLKKWTVIIEDDDQDIVREISGGSVMPGIVKWDARDSKNRKLEDGKYYCMLKTEFRNGNASASFRKELIIDSSPPELSLSFSPSIFSPDGNGENDILTLYPYASDKFGVKNWFLLIYSTSGDLFKTFNGSENPAAEIKWNGRSRNNRLVESATKYYVKLAATDYAGNTSSTGKLKFPIDILILVTERGFRIRISNIEFSYNGSKLNKRAYPILDKLVDIFEKYGSYRVIVEGHIDDIGNDERNLRLSESRAKAVMDYLIDEGVDKSRLTFRGLGETDSMFPNINDDYRRMNRRVEFLLIKK